jgi:hypothetical protein
MKALCSRLFGLIIPLDKSVEFGTTIKVDQGEKKKKVQTVLIERYPVPGILHEI